MFGYAIYATLAPALMTIKNQITFEATGVYFTATCYIYDPEDENKIMVSADLDKSGGPTTTTSSVINFSDSANKIKFKRTDTASKITYRIEIKNYTESEIKAWIDDYTISDEPYVNFLENTATATSDTYVTIPPADHSATNEDDKNPKGCLYLTCSCTQYGTSFEYQNDFTIHIEKV